MNFHIPPRRGVARLDAERLWAPWRLEYVSRGEDQGETPPDVTTTDALSFAPGADPECFLCRCAADSLNPQTTDRVNLVVHRGRHTVVVLNRYPYNNGHLLIAPRLHKGRLDELTEEEQSEMHRTMSALTVHFEQLMRAEGFNIGLNLGRAAGAGVPDHLHWHLVPRWAGDVNFMTSLAGTRVIPQALDALWELLTEALSDKP